MSYPDACHEPESLAEAHSPLHDAPTLTVSADTIQDLERQLAELDAARAKVAAELAKARAALLRPARLSNPIGAVLTDKVPETAAEKVALFLRLFRCRESVYPKRWENTKKQTAGYAPACNNEWVRGICDKPRVKCSECPSQAFPKLDEMAAETHLKGLQTIGTYAIRADDTCTFLACDFDGQGWKEDIAVYRAVAEDMGVIVAVERSRSGNGGHAWVFFSEPVPARLARALGTLIMARCSERRYSLSLESYDRFFPNQDFLPRGGFGNLIALPLQKLSRENGNSVFVDDGFEPHSDQWQFLASVRRLSLPDLRTVLERFLPRRENKAEVDTSLEIDGALLDAATSDDEPGFDGRVEIGVHAQLVIPIDGMSSKLITKLRRTASFANPKFYELQRMRLPTYPNPRFIFSGEMRPNEILLPRGVLEKAQSILNNNGAEVVLRDDRPKKHRLKVAFSGELTEEQARAVAAMKKHEAGILVAPPGAGKTVMGCALIAERKVSTLVLLHRQPLVEQWKESLRTFLGLGKGDFGVIAGSKKKRTGKIDLCMLQTLTKLEELNELAADYTQVIIDECHHIPAASFEGVMKQLPARYVVGLTATPYRKDGLEKILFMQCGPVRHEMASVDGGVLKKEVVVRETGFRPPEDAGTKLPYHVLMELITTDAERTRRIAADAAAAIGEGRVPLVISDRKDHLRSIDVAIRANAGDGPVIFQLDGDLSAKERKLTLTALTERLAAKLPLVLLATASLIGEGFDLPALDTLLLAMPLSFEGRMVQYAGRLHRAFEGKTGVRIYDYVDAYNAMTLKMYRKRIKAYTAMGYEVVEPSSFFSARTTRQRSIFEMNMEKGMSSEVV